MDVMSCHHRKDEASQSFPQAGIGSVTGHAAAGYRRSRPSSFLHLT